MVIEDDVSRLSEVKLRRVQSGVDNAHRLEEVMGRDACPGLAAFLDRYDGGALGKDMRVLTFKESLAHVRGPRKTVELQGLWPVVDRGGRLFAVDSEGAEPGSEWPVVEIAGRSVDRAGSSFLRFLHTLLAELGEPPRDEMALAEAFCERDPGFAEHWLDRAELLDRAERAEDASRVIAEGVRCATPPGPALVLALGLRAFDKGDEPALRAALDDALTLEPLTARDDDARLDAAALALVLAQDDGDEGGVKRAREILGTASSSTGAYFRAEAVRALARDNRTRAALALRAVELLSPDDADARKLRDDPGAAAAARWLLKARDALDRGDPQDAVMAARAAVGERADLGICHAMLAECLNARHDRAALEAAETATRLNPALADGWRELGDAQLEGRQAVKAEAAYRELALRDESSGLGFAKLAQALLEQGRNGEALAAINSASEKGGDVFFIAAVRGDVLSEMNRHREAAEAYEQALAVDPEDHWALHQAALEHGRSGDITRAAELFERAIEFDRDGCHQTLVDFADLLRRMGRIGDAVRLYRKAVQAVPGDTDWRQVLRAAEKELQSAPN